MHYGVHVFITAESISATEACQAAEELGFDSFWLPEHTHIPTGRATDYPLGGDLPEEYRRCFDPLIGLSLAAAVTTRIRLGTGIMLAAQRDPITTAKAVASLDVASGGRMMLGTGFGWNQDEMSDHGVDYARRRDIAREKTRAMQSLWADEEAEYHGDFVNFGPCWSWPKPLQADARGRRHVPVYLGGSGGPKLFTQVVEYGTGWLPLGGKGLGMAIPQLRAHAEQAGRDPSELEILPFGVSAGHGRFDHFESLGVTGAIFNLPSAPRDEVLPALEKLAAFVAERRG